MNEIEVQCDVAVLGAGPAGIVCALELAKKGHRVCLVESGVKTYEPRIQQLADLDDFNPSRHAPTQLCTRRQLGGASVTWGGRCVPYDRVDFDRRDHVPCSSWPIGYDDLAPYFGVASKYCFCGKPQFSTLALSEIAQKTIVPGLYDGDVQSTDLERWSLPTNFWREYQTCLRRHEKIDLWPGFTCVRLERGNGGNRICTALMRSVDGRTMKVVAKVFVLACGALEATRLLLNSSRNVGGLGNTSGLLGRYYMGHISGNIARVEFTTNPKQTHYGFLRDREGVYVRPRFTFSRDFQHRARLTNIATWLVNPLIGDPRHRNGVLSFAYLALSSPLGSVFAPEAIRKSAIKGCSDASIWRHVRNIAFDLPRTVAFVPTFGIKRFACWRKVPGFFQYSASNKYDLHYHGEQIPNYNSRVTLSEKLDDVGMPRLNVDLQYTDQDVDSVVRAHEYLDTYLRQAGVGKLEYVCDDVRQAVWDQASDGYHQIGTTRMSACATDGVVDPDCRVHGVDNLFVASSSTFVTSGQANSTFMIVAFAVRIAERVSRTFFRNTCSSLLGEADRKCADSLALDCPRQM